MNGNVPSNARPGDAFWALANPAEVCLNEGGQWHGYTIVWIAEVDGELVAFAPGNEWPVKVLAWGPRVPGPGALNAIALDAARTNGLLPRADH